MTQKYVILIMDGAAGWPVSEKSGKTTLELARTPNLDALTRSGRLGLTHNVPEGMEPSSAIACMSLLGYDPGVYYRGRAAIEAVSMGIPIGPGEVVFRCNLVSMKAGRMWSYCSGHISDAEARELIHSLNDEIDSDEVRFYPGVGYRHLLKITGHPDTASAVCTPPHDIPDRLVAEYLPTGEGSTFLRGLMASAEWVLQNHPVNLERIARGLLPATSAWLFWGSGAIPDTPPFSEKYGLNAAMTSAVDLLKGLGMMTGMTILEIPGMTDGMDNDFAAQAGGALAALDSHGLIVVHVEAPDEAGHAGRADEKVMAIEKIDELVVGRLRGEEALRLLILPDHPTPVAARTHVAGPVPFLMYGPGFAYNGGLRFTEPEAAKTGIIIHKGHNILNEFIS